MRNICGAKVSKIFEVEKLFPKKVPIFLKTNGLQMERISFPNTSENTEKGKHSDGLTKWCDSENEKKGQMDIGSTLGTQMSICPSMLHAHCKPVGLAAQNASYFTLATIALKASGLFTARSARTLRLISMPALCRLPIS